MFGSKKEVTIDTALEQVGTIIGPGATIEGPLTTKDSTRIDGNVKGNVSVSGALIVGQEGRITGTVSCLNAYVAGEIVGNISSPKGKVEISDSGKVFGDITCKGIVIDENAVFQGKCEMTNLDKNSAAIAKERAAADKAAETAENASNEAATTENNAQTSNQTGQQSTNQESSNNTNNGPFHGFGNKKNKQ